MQRLREKERGGGGGHGRGKFPGLTGAPEPRWPWGGLPDAQLPLAASWASGPEVAGAVYGALVWQNLSPDPWPHTTRVWMFSFCQTLLSPSPSAPPSQLPLINPGQPHLGPMPLPSFPKTCPTSMRTRLAHPNVQLGEAGKLGGQPLALTLLSFSKLEGDANHTC